MISVEKIDGRIAVKFPYNTDHIEKIKSIDGYRWHIQKKYWYFPNNDGIVEKILSAFPGEDISIDLELKEFYTLERELVSRKYPFTVVQGFIRITHKQSKNS
ncbi:hypothetical protein BEH94_09615 [Candidatus Altiarchaeales archaeon WOR_SM1_SCG]|nr:hypothetical protein BEH94_09615 [Candidatus Altiarchaeales archaeon WOR_SM1_SCG]